MSPLISLYDDFAAEYERTRVPRFRPFVKKLLQLYDTRPGSYVLDAGCGTGLASTMVAPRAGHGGKIVGVDGSAKMLEIARHKAEGYGFDQCQFILGDITALDVPAETFDLVICSFALWGNPDHLFGEFFRVLKPNSALLLQQWTEDRGEAHSLFEHACKQFLTPSPDATLQTIRQTMAQQGAWWGPMKSAADYEQALKRVGFKSARAAQLTLPAHFAAIPEFIEFLSIGVRYRAELLALPETTRAQFVQAVTAALQPVATPQGIDLEWTAIQALARK